ncbi:hypothetical protein SAMN05444166_6932 [Singulisphaera sp. GP187]|nr:hypothetical protein SAMN05444166_6932 [Singulisphaera sp. GP187]
MVRNRGHYDFINEFGEVLPSAQPNRALGLRDVGRSLPPYDRPYAPGLSSELCAHPEAVRSVRPFPSTL